MQTKLTLFQRIVHEHIDLMAIKHVHVNIVIHGPVYSTHVSLRLLSTLVYFLPLSCQGEIARAYVVCVKHQLHA
jgi:hypothetical protein